MSRRRNNTAISVALVLLSVFIPIGMQAQTPQHGDHPFLSATDSSDLMLCIEGQGFFVNNEHAGSSRVSGYTLPGFYLRPHVEWRFERNAELQIGLHWLHFWGNNTPDGANGTGLVSSTLDSLKPPTIVPWLRIQYNPIPEMTIVLGSLANDNGHRLPLPLYNPERIFAVAPESGIQVMATLPWLSIDSWADWQNFIWNKSAEREVFVFGTSAEPNFSIGRTRLHLPLHFLAKHLGGENRTDTTLDVETHYNAAAGTGISYDIGQVNMRADCMVMLYGRTGPSDTEPVYATDGEGWWYMTSPRRNFKHGMGIYPRLTAQWKGLWIESSYWTSEGFVPLLGCYHYSNVSVNTSNMTHNRIQVAALRARWTWNKSDRYSMRLYGEWFHYFPFTADRTGYAKVNGKSADMFSMGLQISFRPHLSLKHQ